MPDMTSVDRPVVSTVAPLGVWLLVQLLALTLSAARVPLSHRFPTPVEQSADVVMLCTQTLCAALLMPWLFRNRTTSVSVMLTALPMLMASVLLAGVELTSQLDAWAYLLGWLLTLAVWSNALRTDNSKRFGVTLASAWCLGGVILRYVHQEFQTGASETGWLLRVMSGPLVGVVEFTRETRSSSIAPVLSMLTVLILGIIVNVVRSRQFIHRLSTV